MSNRIDKEREAELQPVRMDYAKEKIQALGFEITYEDKTRIEFKHKGCKVLFYPYSGWHSGRTINDGRGLDNLLKQLQPL